MSERQPFDLSATLPVRRTVVEASAGTGKTYSLTALITRYIAEAAVPVDEILVVTFTRAAANELRERTREMLVSAIHAIEVGEVPPRHAWMSALVEQHTLLDPLQRRERLVEAVTRFDDLTITTIHGFCQQALGQLGLRSGSDRQAVLVENTRDLVAEVCRDLLVSELADDPAKLSMTVAPGKKSRSPGQVQTALIDTVLGVLTNPGGRWVPHDVARAAHSMELHLASRWADIVERARAETQRRQRLRGQIGYDSLVGGLRDALVDPQRGASVASQLAGRFRVVLVDEFQDTDRLQWQVFDTAFRDRALITVGDPKQAIYRFRGADVHAYLAAIAGSSVLDLAVNYRSDRAVLAGLETLFEGATLGDPRIGFLPVAARPDAPQTALRRGDADVAASPSVHLRMVPLDDRLRRGRSQLAMPLVRPLILADV